MVGNVNAVNTRGKTQNKRRKNTEKIQVQLLESKNTENRNRHKPRGTQMYYRTKQRARRRRHTITVLRDICGVAAFIFFILALGKAGASDCGAAWEEIFPSTLYYIVGFILSSFAWEILNKIR